MLFIIRQQVQPAFIMAAQQSQHAWIIAQQSLSPLVHVMVTPFSVISHLHMATTMLQQQAIIPFIIMFMPVGIVAGPPIIAVPIAGVLIPVIPIPARSISLLIIFFAPSCRAIFFRRPDVGPESDSSIGRRPRP